MDAVCSDFLLLLLNLVIINHAILLVTLSGMLKDFMMIRKMMLIAMGMLLSISLAVGQQVCSALVEQALQAVDDNCNDLIRNTACYAYNQVQATFFQDVSNDFFSNPADRADLTYLDTIQTTPLDEDNDLWGIAMMSVQAKIRIFPLFGFRELSGDTISLSSNIL